MVTDEVRTTTETQTETAPAPPEAAAPPELETPPAEATEAEASAPVPDVEAVSPPEPTPPPDAVVAAPAPEEPEPAAPEPPSNKHWYVVKVQSGREETIKDAIERKVKIEGLEEFYGQIYIPTEKVTEMRSGKRYTRTKKKLPGYIMAEVEYNDRILYLFRETSGVGDFVGATNNKPPPPMPAHEVAKWLTKPGEKEPEGGKVAAKHDFEKGDRVRVKDGMFKDMEGEVKNIFEEKNQAQVELTIFGRPVLVDLEYWQVERV